MAAAPRFKVYDSAGNYQAATKEVEAAAALVAFYGAGSTIRAGHAKVVWAEGQEEIEADESYDVVALTVISRL
jgi:hypothetical protein